MLDSQIEVLDVDVQEGQDEFILDGFPDYSGHFISVELSYRLSDLDFGGLHVRYGINYSRRY